MGMGSSGQRLKQQGNERINTGLLLEPSDPVLKEGYTRAIGKILAARNSSVLQCVAVYCELLQWGQDSRAPSTGH